MRRHPTCSSLVLALTIGLGLGGSLNAGEPRPLQPETKPAADKPAAEQSTGEKPSAGKPAKLDVEVTALLRRTAQALENRSIEPEEQAGFHALITAGDLLRADKTLAPSERERLRALCRVRLAQAEEVLRRQTAKQSAEDRKNEADGKRKVVARNAVLERPKTVDEPTSPTLAQQLPAGGFGGQNLGGGGNTNATRASAEALMEIITSTIKPESWEENGGKGVIRYFQLGHGMVIRATADVHGDLGGLIGQLRN